MLNITARITLFVSSYAPLAAIFAILYWGKRQIVADVSVAIGIIGILGLLWIVYGAALGREPLRDKVVECRQSGDVMGYIAAYLIPFLTVDLSSLRQIAALAIFLGFWEACTSQLICCTLILHLTSLVLRCLMWS